MGSVKVAKLFFKDFPNFIIFLYEHVFKERIWMAASGLLSYSFAQYEQKEEY